MIGTVQYYRGQRYEVVETTERRRKDGSIATILHWQSPCAQCGEPFRLTTPAASSKFQPNRRCVKHKRPGIRVKESA